MIVVEYLGWDVDAARVVSWLAGKKSPKTNNYGSMTGQGALSGAFWGMLFGLIFFVPFFGMAVRRACVASQLADA